VLPAAASLRKQGANKGATTAFLISTPESGVDSIAITYALLDPILTVVRPLAALVSAVVAGLAQNILFWKDEDEAMTVDRSCPVDNCCDGVECPEEVHNHHHTFVEKMLAGLRFGYLEVWGDIVGWFFIGLFIAALITALVPDDLMATLLGGGLSSMLVMVVVGIPLYICATASTPVAAALIMKGVSPGAALVFLLVGPATNVTSLFVLTGILGKRGTAMYLALLSGCAVLFGLGLDALYGTLGISAQAILGNASDLLPEGVKLITAFALLGLSMKPLIAQLRTKFARKPAPTVYFSGFPAMSGTLTGPVKSPVSISAKGHCGCGK
jgi:uncharacterized protein